MHILDWEFFTNGAKFVDLGHFAAEAWLHHHFYPASRRGESFPLRLTAALFQAYRANGGEIEMQPVTYYIAGHIGCFLGYTEWTQDPGNRNAAALLAVEMIEIAAANDWDKLKEKDHFFNVLLH